MKNWKSSGGGAASREEDRKGGTSGRKVLKERSGEGEKKEGRWRKTVEAEGAGRKRKTEGAEGPGRKRKTAWAGRAGGSYEIRGAKRIRRTGRTDYRVYTFSPVELLKYGFIGMLLGVCVVWLCYHSLFAAPVAVPVMVFYVLAKKKQKREERQRLLNYHFRDFLSSLHTNLLAGYSLENGVRMSASDLTKLYGRRDPLAAELKDITGQMRFGKPVEQLFLELGTRSGVEDIMNFSEVLVIAKRTGGDMSHILESTWRNICEKIDTRQEIDTVTASRRYEQSIMSFMPAGIILYMRVTFEGFSDKIYGNPAGAVLMTFCLILYAGAFAAGRKMCKIEV
ncbi:type II secretion system F family protein [Bilifractor sp. HCP3S3_D3]|uniref:type II secretion system F family protein n=1 Tax=unclassified Bilifractor TaxID=2815795 RepID=UPI003F893F01